MNDLYEMYMIQGCDWLKKFAKKSYKSLLAYGPCQQIAPLIYIYST